MSRYLTLFIVIVIVALGVRAGAAVWWQSRLPEGTSFSMPDTDSYWHLGQKLANGQPYEYPDYRGRIFRAPGLPALLALLFTLTGDQTTVLNARLMGCLFGSATVAALMLLTRYLFDDRTSLIAGALATLYPGAVAMSVLVLSEAPFCLLMVAHLGLWALAWKADTTTSRIGWSALGGMVAGLAVLTRPSWLLFLPFAFTVGMLLGPRRRRHVVVCTSMLIGLVLVMSPWWARSLYFTGRFVPTTLQVGASLYDGIHPEATGASNMEFVGEFFLAELAKERASPIPADDAFEYSLDRRMRDAAIAHAREHPGHVLQLAAIKFIRIWNIWPNADEFGSTTMKLVTVAGFLPLLAFGVIGVFQYARRDWPYLLCVIPAVYFTLLHMIFVGSIRYRQPAMLILIVLAAGAMSSALDRYRHLRAQRTNE